MRSDTKMRKMGERERKNEKGREREEEGDT
jgi:hypothetical protein